MGLLDDAIREHLDLKRRRGADPDEVARLEHEALGPVRREPVQSEQSEPRPEHHEPAPAPTASDATHVLPPEDRHEPPHGDKLHEQAELGGAAAPQAADADRAGDAGEAISAAPSAEALAPAAGPARSSARPEQEASPAEDPRHSDIVHQPTTEFRVEDHHDDEHERQGEAPPAKQSSSPDDDVLEETPDFLQETPEHDRLWFEQRPPRDFDFDG